MDMEELNGDELRAGWLDFRILREVFFHLHLPTSFSTTRRRSGVPRALASSFYAPSYSASKSIQPGGDLSRLRAVTTASDSAAAASSSAPVSQCPAATCLGSHASSCSHVRTLYKKTCSQVELAVMLATPYARAVMLPADAALTLPMFGFLEVFTLDPSAADELGGCWLAAHQVCVHTCVYWCKKEWALNASHR